jgi:hypothetical protein
MTISRLGHTVLLLSTRSAEVAYVSLVEATNASFLIAHDSFQIMTANVSRRTGVIVQPVLERDNYDIPTNSSLRLHMSKLDGPIETNNV